MPGVRPLPRDALVRADHLLQLPELDLAEDEQALVLRGRRGAGGRASRDRVAEAEAPPEGEASRRFQIQRNLMTDPIRSENVPKIKKITEMEREPPRELKLGK